MSNNPGMPGQIPTRNVMEEDFGWEVPVDTVPVPSQGKVYPSDSPLFGRESLDIYAMTAKQEDILSSRALIRKGTVIDHLLKSCMVDQGVNPQDMLVGDRNALMVAVRITGYGAEYNSDVTCPACGLAQRHDFNLAGLGIKRLQIEPAEPGANIFNFTLPVTGKEVKFKFLTGRDENDITVANERRKKSMPGLEIETSVTARLERAIVSVDGVADQTKIAMFVNRMPARDSKALRKYMLDNEPGIDMSTWMKCAGCGESSQISLPIGINFFWPD